MTMAVLPHLPAHETKILSALAGRRHPLSGHEIRIETQIKLGSVYTVLNRMIAKGYLERVDATGRSDTDRPKIFYLLTDYGSRVLKAHTAALRVLKGGQPQ